MAVERRFTRFDRFVLWPLVVPVALLAAGNDDFGFDPPGSIDASVYLGYFWHYPEHLWIFDDNNNYKISRLPWVLPGFALHSLFGPIVAGNVLAFLTVAAGAVAMYLLVRDIVQDRNAAAITGVAWAGCTWAHGIGGWSYHMLAASAYYLTACWLVVRTARNPRSALTAVIAGAVFTAAIHTYIFLIVFTPLVVVLYWAALPSAERSVVRHARAAGLMATGGLVLTVVLAAINRATGGAWLFFMPQVEAAWKYSQPAADLWWISAAQWLPTARYLVIPLAFLVAGLAVVLRRRDDTDRRLSFTVVALGWAALAMMVFFQFVRRQTTLDYSFMAFPLYLFAFPCAAVALASARLERTGRPVVVGTFTAAVVGTLLMLMPESLPRWMEALSGSLAGSAALPPLVPPLVFTLSGVALMWLLPTYGRVAVFAVWFSVVNAWIAPNPSFYGVGTPGYHRHVVGMIREADRFTADLDPSLYGIKYWLSNEELPTPVGVIQTRAVFDTFLSTRAWFGNLYGRVVPSPPMDQLTIEDLQRGTCVGILSSVNSMGRLRTEMEARFMALGQPMELVATRRIDGSHFSFGMTILKPSSATGDTGHDRGKAPCMSADHPVTDPEVP